MKVRIIQPPYTLNSEDLEKNFQRSVALMRECNEPLDVVVLPEYCDVPAAQTTKAGYHGAIARYNEAVMNEAIALARRCHANVFINCAHVGDFGARNTTHVIDREGNIVGRYYKAHPAPREDKPESMGGNEMDSSYSTPGALPYTVELEGIRYGFLTCYDFYMYETFARLAREDVDIIIGCSHQRTDTHEALEIINRFLSYNTNAYLLRASVSLGEDSLIGGGSCVIAPDGKVLVDMKSRAGYETVEIDPEKKYYKAAGFNGKQKSHYAYIEEGRRPWIYRNGGAGVVRFDSLMPYPRVCALRGFNTVAPESSLAAFGAAVALGAEEISLDLWRTKDGVLVASRDESLERLSNGTGKICEHTLAELKRLDFGAKHGEKFAGLRIATLEEILEKLASRTVMNIHLKEWEKASDEGVLSDVIALIHKYDAEKHSYLTSTNTEMLALLKARCSEIGICVEAGENAERATERAVAIGAEKIELAKEVCTAETIQAAHESGIRVNLSWVDDPKEAVAFIQAGVDCILTNDYLAVKNALLGVKAK